MVGHIRVSPVDCVSVAYVLGGEEGSALPRPLSLGEGSLKVSPTEDVLP